MDWPTAFLRQARADYDLLRVIEGRDDVPDCHRLHMLQMAREKLAKAHRCPPAGPPEPTHVHLVSFLRSPKGRQQYRRLLGYRSRRQSSATLDQLLPLARRIEQLAPAAGGPANAEYPFGDGAGGAIAPVDYSFDALHPRDVKMRLLRSLLDRLLDERLDL